MDSGGAIAAVLGDSLFIGSAIKGQPQPIPSPHRGKAYLEFYFGKTDRRAPLQSPAYHPAVLSRFPPTLLFSSTRDELLSSVLFTHRELEKAGAKGSLHIWEGMDHCFTYQDTLPEAREAYDIMLKFFDKHLGRGGTPSIVIQKSELVPTRPSSG